jgi:hypothetical protein
VASEPDDDIVVFSGEWLALIRASVAKGRGPEDVALLLLQAEECQERRREIAAALLAFNEGMADKRRPKLTVVPAVPP